MVFFLEGRGGEGGELENKLNKYRYYVCVCVCIGEEFREPKHVFL